MIEYGVEGREALQFSPCWRGTELQQKSGSGYGFGKGKKMFTVIRSSYSYQGSIEMHRSFIGKGEALILCVQIRISLKENAVGKGVGLSE